MNSDQREPCFSPPSALALSNMEEGMGHNVERAQALQEELVQRRASLHHESAEAQALQGQEGNGPSDTGMGPVTFTSTTGRRN